MAKPAWSRRSIPTSRETEKYNGSGARRPASWLAPQSAPPALLPPHSAEPRARGIHSSLSCPAYGWSVGRFPEKYVSVADAATQSPWPTYYSSATPPSTPRSNPDSPQPPEKTFLLL